MQKKFLWILTVILFYGLVLTSCSNDDAVTPPPAEVEAMLKKMTLREKVGQMFFVRVESLDPSIEWTTYDDLANLKNQEITMKMRKVNHDYPVGQLANIIKQVRSLNGSPLLCIDEEGGRVSRIANNPNFHVKKYESMAAIGATGDPKNAYECGNTIGTYLKRYDFDIDFAPVADVNTNPDNIIIGPRAFSDDPAKDAGITGCIKHFPGHGDTTNDTHSGYVQSLKTWDEMNQCEMVTFRAGIQWGCQLIMTAHIAVPNVTGTNIPSTLSSVVLQDKLRGELGYQNIIITDGMEMGGTLTEERINQSVRRILTLRYAMKRMPQLLL